MIDKVHQAQYQIYAPVGHLMKLNTCSVTQSKVSQVVQCLTDLLPSSFSIVHHRIKHVESTLSKLKHKPTTKALKAALCKDTKKPQ